jgi:uncharacterized coiled-coil DUF342 family protein
MTKENAEEALNEVSSNLREAEVELQSKVSQSSQLCHRFIELEEKIFHNVQSMEQRKQKIKEQFSKINQKNKELAQKSKEIFQKLQFLSKKYGSNFKNEHFSGVMAQSNFLVKLKMKENDAFLNTLLLDIRQVV